MLLQLKPLFLGDVSSLPIDCELDFSQVEFQGAYPFSSPVRVTGAVTAATGIVRLRVKATYTFDGVCDRCTAPIHREVTLPLEHILVDSLNHEDESELILVEQYQLPLDELVQADLILNLPLKNLCREDCRGLCPSCGKNLNEGLCGCVRETVDPRLAALKQLLDD